MFTYIVIYNYRCTLHILYYISYTYIHYKANLAAVMAAAARASNGQSQGTKQQRYYSTPCGGEV